jgi:hypothetical protein
MTDTPPTPPVGGAGQVPVLNEPTGTSDHNYNVEPRVTGDLNATYTSTLGRFLDPVRAHALEQAIAHVNYNGVEGPDVPGEVLAIAERFETWLARDGEG